MNLERVWSTALTEDDYAGLASLFDSEYLEDWGPWTPRQDYGYARFEMHAIAREDSTIIGHAGTSRRFVDVGGREVTIAGIGGVVVHPDARGQGVGQRVIESLRESMTSEAPAEFGFLGCRDEVVPFYESCGFVRVANPVREVSHRDGMTVLVGESPTLVCPGTASLAHWPNGTIDLRGLPW